MSTLANLSKEHGDWKFFSWSEGETLLTFQSEGLEPAKCMRVLVDNIS